VFYPFYASLNNNQIACIQEFNRIKEEEEEEEEEVWSKERGAGGAFNRVRAREMR
jgi:hypothetical protein